MSLTFRRFDHFNEEPERIFELFSKIYGNGDALRDRWYWEIMDHPSAREIRILVAEEGDKLAGATTRLPFTFVFKGKKYPAFYNVNSMVDPEFRRRGIMKRLYEWSAETMPLLFSKGTSPAMYSLLMRLGFQPIEPNTFLIAMLAPSKWLWWKITGRSKKPDLSKPVSSSYTEFIEFDWFDDRLDVLYAHSINKFTGLADKDQRYMNWRYRNIPHRTYRCFIREINEKPASVVVLGGIGSKGCIVDCIWDPTLFDEPLTTIKFARSWLQKAGFIKASCWATYEPFRDCLSKAGFLERRETPNFSVYSKHQDIRPFLTGNRLHFVHGDSDTEYI